MGIAINYENNMSQAQTYVWMIKHFHDPYFSIQLHNTHHKVQHHIDRLYNEI